MPERGSVLILDLDGTVLTVNSFPRWVMFMLQGKAVPRTGWRQLPMMATVVALLAARKARLIGHETLKWQLQRSWEQAVRYNPGCAAARFADSLLPFVQPALRDVLAAIRADHCDALLATAAPAEYAVPLGQRLGFADILATGSDRAERQPSNVREHKRDAVLAFLSLRQWLDRERILFTDHEDDLPLMAVCQTVYWFGSAAAERLVVAALPGLRLLPGTAAQGVVLGLRSVPPGPPARAAADLRETA